MSAAQPKDELKRRHVAIAYHIVREAYAIGLVNFYHIKGEHNPSDILTKPLEKVKLRSHLTNIL